MVPQYSVEMDDGEPVFHYQRFQGASDLLYVVEVSDDMEVWSSNSPNDQATGEEIVDSSSYGVEHIGVPILGPGVHVRLRITLKE